MISPLKSCVVSQEIIKKITKNSRNFSFIKNLNLKLMDKIRIDLIEAYIIT